MEYIGRWKKLEELGRGGQGIVHKSLDLKKYNPDNVYSDFYNSLKDMLVIGGNEKGRQDAYLRLEKTLELINSKGNSQNYGALKELYNPNERESQKCLERLKLEIQTMAEVDHPNLIKILDHDNDYKWYVSKFYAKGSLEKGSLFLNLNREGYTGNVLKSLHDFKEIVLGVKELHSKGRVHRDIKPHNIFIDDNEKLVLGDFGLIYYTDPSHTRVSAIIENVGSRDWMPGWAYGKRVEEVHPTFDIYSLGKVLWCMIYGEDILRLWYFDKPDFNLESKFSDKLEEMKIINQLLAKVIVEEEKDCINSIDKFLSEIDITINKIENRACIINDSDLRICPVCGQRWLKLLINNNDLNGIGNFGLKPTGSKSFKIFECDNCGYIQLFSCGYHENPKGWS